MPITASTTTLAKGLGYEVYLDSYGDYTTFENTTLDSRGNPTIGNVPMSASITRVNDGWNLIGNPYASYISWDNLQATTSNISTNIMIYDETISDFAVFTTGAGVELAPHQGFWVNAITATPSLQFSETNKTTTNTSDFRNAATRLFSATVKCKDKSNWFTSTTKFTFNDNTKFGSEVVFRSVPHPLAPSLYSINSLGEKCRIQNITTNNADLTIPVNFKSELSGNFSIELSNIDLTYELGYSCVYLHDKKEEIFFPVNEINSTYNFFHIAGKNDDRFELVFKKMNCIVFTSDLSVKVSYKTTIDKVLLNIEAEESIIGKSTLKNALGQDLGIAIALNGAGTYEIQLPETAGMYILKSVINGKEYTKKIIRQ